MNHDIPSSSSIGSALAALGLAIALAGCGAPFSSTPGTGGGGAGGAGGGSSATSSSGAGVACGADDPCGDGLFCFAPSCGAQGATGTCKPVSSSPAAGPVCGCDGVTYWDDRLGAVSHRLIRAEAACAENDDPKRCSAGGSPCDGERGEVCAFSQALCGGAAGGPGTCWVMPESCEGATLQALRCDGGKSGCESLCEIIKSGKAFHRANDC